MAQSRTSLHVEVQSPTMFETSPIPSSVNSSTVQSRIHTPSSSVPNTPLLLTRPTSPEKQSLVPLDSVGLLTAVAAQERRVLELKEELYKAESELQKLKTQWTIYESNKARVGFHELEHKRIRESSALRGDYAGRIPQWHGRTSECSSSWRTNQRKVFSGSRHARTLSLLSGRVSAPHSATSMNSKPSRVFGEATGSSARVSPPLTASQGASIHTQVHKDPQRPMDHDAILQTGKQLVGGFKSGLWTFLEDLKQVTVGEEVSKQAEEVPNRPRKQGSSLGKTTRMTISPNAKETITRQHVALRCKGGARNEHCANAIEVATADFVAGEKRNGTADTMLDRNANSSDSEYEWDSWDSPDAKAGDVQRRDTQVEPMVGASP